MGVTEVGPESALVPWWRRADWGALLVVLVALASSASGIGNGFAYDDVPIVELNARVSTLRWPWVYFTETYWSPPWAEALYRPITIFVFSLQWWIADWAPVTFHVVNVTAYVAAALLLLRLARTLVRPGVALGVATLWAVHPVHVEVVANVVGQSELWVLLASLTAIDVWRRALASHALSAGGVTLVLSCVAVAVGAKESGIVLPVVLATMWYSGAGRAAVPEPVRRVGALSLRAMGYLVLLYLGARYAILGSLGGDVPHIALAHLPTVQRMLVALGLVVDDAHLLLAPGPLQADYSPPAFPIHPTVSVTHLLALALIGVAVLTTLYLYRRRRVIWPLLWAGLAILPTSNFLFPTGVVLAERSLFVPSVGVALALGQLVDLLLERHGAKVRPVVRRLALAGAAGVAVIWGSVSAARHPVWVDTATLIASSVVEDVENPRWQRVMGVHFLRARDWDRAEAHFRAAAALASGDFHVVFGMVRVLERQGRCEEALTWYRELLREFPPTTRAHLGEVACQLRTRRYRAARRSALAARAAGFEPEPLTILIALADSMLRVSDSLGTPGANPPVPWGGGEPPVVEVDDAGRLIRRDVGGNGASSHRRIDGGHDRLSVLPVSRVRRKFR